jgi:hypothetical protein
MGWQLIRGARGAMDDNKGKVGHATKKVRTAVTPSESTDQVKAKRKHSTLKFSDPIAQRIFELNLRTLEHAKACFRTVYADDDEEFLPRMIDVLSQHDDLDSLANDLFEVISIQARGLEGDEEPLKHIDPYLAMLISVQINDGKGSRAFVRGKAYLILIFVLYYRCSKALERNDILSAIDEYAEGRFVLGSSMATLTVLFGEESVRALATRGVAAKLQNDPRQSEKQLVKDCWKMWQEDSSRYKGKAAFARDMLGKYENLKSQPVIEGWCRDWEVEAKRSTD